MHALRVEREGINIVAGRNATTHIGIKQVRLCLVRVGVAQCGQQVHPDQTKAVKGQDHKTLAMASAIKRPLPCPVKRRSKIEHIFGVKERNRARAKRKKIRKKIERKERKTKKNGSYSKRACTHRSVSLSPLQILSPSENVNKDHLSFGTATIQIRLPQSH